MNSQTMENMMLDTEVVNVTNEFVKVSVTLDVSDELSTELIDQLNSACDKAEDGGVNSVVVFHLIGCTEDVHSQSKCSVGDIYLMNKWEKSLRRIEKLDSIIITVADSHIGGLGLAIILTSDYRILAQDLSLALADSSGIIMPGMLLYRLVHQLGSAKLRNLVLFGRELTSNEAKEMQLVDEVTVDTKKSVADFIMTIVPKKAQDLAVRRRLLLEASSISYEDALGTNLAACDRVLRQN